MCGRSFIAFDQEPTEQKGQGVTGLTGNEPSRISHGKLQGRGRSPLVVASRVVGVPDEHARDAGVQAGGHEAGHCEAGLRRGHVGDGGIACDGDGQGEEHDDPAELEAVGEESNGDL